MAAHGQEIRLPLFSLVLDGSFVAYSDICQNIALGAAEPALSTACERYVGMERGGS
jgi:hypothetical protein